MYLTSKNFKDGKLDLSKIDYISPNDYERHFKEKSTTLTKPKAGDVLFSIIGSIGEPYLVRPQDLFGLSSSVSILRANTKIIFPKYLYYWIRGHIFQNALYGIKGGVAQGYVSLEMIKSLPLVYPPLSTQHKITTILSAYDDFIENNTRRIKILEEMAQALYREWFVNFRFPGHEKVKIVESEFGLKPGGWEVKTLKDVLKGLESGTRPKGGINPLDCDVPSIGAENILGLGQYDYSKEKYISSTFYENMKRGRVRSGDVLLYKDGAKIGRKAMFVDGFPHTKCCINEHVFILRTNDCCSQNYLYFWLDQPEMTQKIRNLNANAAQPGINQAGVRSLPIILPDQTTFNKFESIIEPLLIQLFNLAKKNIILRHSRDLLLPKLISGEVDVSGIDITTGEAT